MDSSVIKSIGQISKSLTELLKKYGFKWGDHSTVAFQKLKNALISAPVLALQDVNITFVVETNACDVNIGAVIRQEGHVIAYLSKGFSPQHQAIFVSSPIKLNQIFNNS